MYKSLLFLTLSATLAIVLFAACEPDSSIPVGDLPPAVKIYVETNYPGYTIDEAEQETDCAGAKVYDVEIEQGEDNDLELTFDESGNFLYSETEIGTGELPAAVTNSIASNYAGYSTDEADKLNMADGSTRFAVELEKGKTDKEVLFDSEGTVICEQDEQ